MTNEQLIHDHYDRIYKLAKSLANAYNLSFEAFEDLQKAGYTVLLEQSGGYDESKGEFWAYVYPAVRLKMLAEVRFLLDTVTIPEHLNKQLTQVRRLRSQYSQFSFSALMELIAEQMKVSADKAEELLILSGKEKISLDSYLDSQDNEDAVRDKKLDKALQSDEPSPEEVTVQRLSQDAAILLEKLDTVLTARQAEYVRMYFGIGCRKQTYAEIGEEFCVSASMVEKSVKGSLERLRKALEEKA